MIPDSAMTNHQRYVYEVGLGHSTPVACLVSKDQQNLDESSID